VRYRKLGRPGIKVSEIGFGGWGIGGGWGHQDDKEAMRVLKQALDLGITFLDTALAYGDGHSERLIGQAVAGMRDRVVIATKIPTKTYRWPILTHESSCILGIAIEEGKIPSADAKIVDYYTDNGHKGTFSRREECPFMPVLSISRSDGCARR